MEFKNILNQMILDFLQVFPDHQIFNRSVRPFVLRILGSKVGKRVHVGKGINISYGSPKNLIIGNNMFINRDVKFACTERTEIGNNVSIGPRCSFENTNHKYKAGKRETAFKQIKVGDNVWLGSGVIILPGAVIEELVDVAAGSVVSKTLKRRSLYAGVPAKKIKKY